MYYQNKTKQQQQQQQQQQKQTNKNKTKNKQTNEKKNPKRKKERNKQNLKRKQKERKKKKKKEETKTQRKKERKKDKERKKEMICSTFMWVSLVALVDGVLEAYNAGRYKRFTKATDFALIHRDEQGFTQQFQRRKEGINLFLPKTHVCRQMRRDYRETAR